jgi:hypothetical protein
MARGIAARSVRFRFELRHGATLAASRS